MGHSLDRPELLLAHLCDDALKELQALVSGFVPTLQGRGWVENGQVSGFSR